MKNIPLIHSYCDRWCERCPMTSRCSVFSGKQKTGAPEMDLQDEAYWQSINSNLKKGLDLLGKAAEKFGVDLEHISDEEIREINRKEKVKKRQINDHPLSRAAKKYGDRVFDLIEDDEFWKQTGTGIVASFATGVSTEEKVKTELQKIGEYREVIGWYSFFIHAKFSRALSGKLDEFGLYDLQDELDDSHQRDENGSAKIALIAVEKSITAWTGLFELIPDEDKIFPLLALLQRIRRVGLEEFPDAEKFIRPGFDALPK